MVYGHRATLVWHLSHVTRGDLKGAIIYTSMHTDHVCSVWVHAEVVVL